MPAFPEGLQFDWQILADLKPRGYAEIRTNANKKMYHGPVESIAITELDMVEIRFRWLAQAELGEYGIPAEDWEVADAKDNPLVFPNLVLPFLIEETPEKGPRARFGFNILYLNEVKGLDPSKVKGLLLKT